MNIVSKISRRLKSCYFKDIGLRSRIEDNIIQSYTNERFKHNTREGETSKDIYVNENYNRKFGFSLPVINNDLRSIISSSNPESDPNHISTPTRNDVQKSDEESIGQYKIIRRSFVRDHSLLWCIASRSAWSHLGLLSKDISEQEGLKFDTLSVQDSINASINSTNSGYPLYRKKNIPETINDCRVWMKQLLHKPTAYTLFKNELMLNPQVLFHRFQPSVDNENHTVEIKTRQVWCVPFRIICLENMFFRNILDNYNLQNVKSTRCSTPSGLTNFQISEKVVRPVRKLIGTDDRKKLFSIDFSKYDRTIPDFAMDLFFCSISEHINLDAKESKLFDLLRYYMKYGPIVHEGKLHFKSRGMSSGSLLTNFFDSWWNIVLLYMSKHFDDHSNDDFGLDPESWIVSSESNYTIEYRYDFSVCGDDIIVYTTDREILRHTMLCNTLGMTTTIDYETSDPFDNVYFLGRFWNINCEPVQTDLYFTAHIIVRSKFYSKDSLPIDISEELEASRIISICAPLSNGMDYVYRTFANYPNLQKLLQKKEFFYIKDFPSDTGYKFKNILSIYDWRVF